MGSLEHQIRYKKDGDFTEAIGDELYHCAKISAELDSRMNSLRNAVQGEKDKSDEEKKQ